MPLATAPQVVAIARGGLERRGHDEASFLNRLEVIAETGLTQVGCDDVCAMGPEGRWLRSLGGARAWQIGQRQGRCALAGRRSHQAKGGKAGLKGIWETTAIPFSCSFRGSQTNALFSGRLSCSAKGCRRERRDPLSRACG